MDFSHIVSVLIRLIGSLVLGVFIIYGIVRIIAFFIELIEKVVKRFRK